MLLWKVGVGYWVCFGVENELVVVVVFVLFDGCDVEVLELLRAWIS